MNTHRVRYGAIVIGLAAELLLVHTATAPDATLFRQALALAGMLIIAWITLSAVRPL